MTSSGLTRDKLELAANTIRFLSAETVEKAASGHPGMPMGMAELAAVLWLNHLRFNAKDPDWLARDRFVLSNGHGSALLYSMLHLSGYQVSLDDLKQFRQWDSITPGHPESTMTPGVETTTGPLGQGVANAVGMALGQKLMEERYATDDCNPVQHRVFCFTGDGCLMEGVSSEASSLAGHLRLGNLTLIYDDNEISIAGHTDLAFSEDVAKRYEAYGWHVQSIDGHDFEQIDQALSQASDESTRPSIIIAKTTIGRGSPNKANTSGVHGSPLGADEMALTKKNMGWASDQPFFVPEETRTIFASRGEQLQQDYQAWQQSFKAWSSKHPDLAKRLEAQRNLETPEDLEEKLISALPTDGKAVASRKLSAAVIQAASANVDSLVGGSADLEPSTLTLIKDSTDINKESFSGKNLRFGVREHAMGSVMNGLAYYGGYLPYGSTFFVFLDYMRPAVRLAALSHLPALYVFTHDSIFVGEDGPTHQPVEQLAIMRLTPNLNTFRPADGLETAVCYAAALERKDGPSAMILTRQNLEPFPRPAGFSNSDIRKGGYSVLEPQNGKAPELVLVASGSEVPLAIAAAKELNLPNLRVVSMPCCELFSEQSESYRESLIPLSANKVVIELALNSGWLELVQGSSKDTLLITIPKRFGASAPYQILAEKFGFTPKQVAESVKQRFC